MKQIKDEPSCSNDQVTDFILAVKELHGFTSQELNKLLRDSENFTVRYLTETGSYVQIDMEKLVRFLPLHLVAVLISSDRDAALFRYLLCGFRLLCSLCSLAPRQPKLEQILLDDVKVSEQLLDLAFYLLIVLSTYRQDDDVFSPIPILHSALVSCSLHLLTECISTQWHDLVLVLLAHPKADVFMDVAFGAVCVDVRFLQMKLSARQNDFSSALDVTSAVSVEYLCQQCEASLNFVHSLCQQKLFRERLLKNKELCGKGGVLLLAQSILKLDVLQSFEESSEVVAAVSRMKSKALSILLHLCEAESISYLDEVASSPGSLALAKSVSLKVLELLKTGLKRDSKYTSSSHGKTYPMGLLQLNAMRLADIFSDDSNFRSYITTYFTEFLTAVFLLPHGEFLSSWCSSNIPLREEDATLEFDPFAAAGWVLDSFVSSNVVNPKCSESTFTASNMPRASYAHQRTSLLVKIIANLHCFVPDICEEQERNLFLHKFLDCLQAELPKSSPGLLFASDAQKASSVCSNLCSLLGHAESLIPKFLNEEDVQLLRVFFKQIQPLISPVEFEANQAKVGQGTVECSSPTHKKVTPDLNNRSINLKEETSDNSVYEEMEFFVKSEHSERTDVGLDGRKDKISSGRAASQGFPEIDRDSHNVETSGSDSSSVQVKNSLNPMRNGEFPKSSEDVKDIGFSGVQEDEKIETVLCEEKQRRKRKRTIMNDEQIAVIERALLDEPGMQRNSALVQSWANKLSVHGSEVTFSQLRNWLNNRKARLARRAKGVRAPLEGDSPNPDKESALRGGFCDSPESPGDDFFGPLSAGGGAQQSTIGRSSSAVENSERSGILLTEFVSPAESVQCERGRYALPLDGQQEEISEGKGAMDAK